MTIPGRNLREESYGKTLVLMEGVSPYMNVDTFSRFFLRFFSRHLPKGSRVAYDCKLSGVDDGFGRIGRTQTPFRLGREREDMVSFLNELGY